MVMKQTCCQNCKKKKPCLSELFRTFVVVTSYCMFLPSVQMKMFDSLAVSKVTIARTGLSTLKWIVEYVDFSPCTNVVMNILLHFERVV